MKTHTTLFTLLAVVIMVSCVTKVAATVGGETLIYDFKYNQLNESIYYTKEDFGGRGCPPELLKVSLSSEKITTEISCDQGEKISLEQITSQINTTTTTFKPLTPLSLKRNNILIDVTFIRSENYSEEINEIIMRHFIASVYQNGKKIKEFRITGCTIDQPFIFQGYSIPGFNKKILLLISAKNNCAEGGYIYESLQVIGGVDNLDKTFAGNFYKRSSPLLPNEGNLTIYESDKINTVNSVTKENLISTSTIPDKEAVKHPVSVFTPIVTEEATKESLLTRLINWFRNLF